MLSAFKSCIRDFFAFNFFGSQNSKPPLQISLVGGAADEGSPITFTVSQDKLSAVDTNVVISVASLAEDSAVDGVDYTGATEEQVTIPAGQLETTFTVATFTDYTNSGDKRFTASIVSASNLEDGVSIQVSAAFGSIGEVYIPALQISIEGSSANEGAGAQFIVSQDRVSDVPTTIIGYASGFAGDTATADLDYDSVTSRTLTIPAGSLSTTFTVSTLTDLFPEGTETVTASLLSATNAHDGAEISTMHAVGSILDVYVAPMNITISGTASITEGNTAQFTVTQDAVQSTDTLAVVSLSASTASAGDDYTDIIAQSVVIPAGSLSASFDVTVIPDDLFETIEYFTVTLDSATNASCQVTITSGNVIVGIIERFKTFFAPTDVLTTSTTGVAARTVGHRITSAADGTVFGIRFYKSASGVSTHTGAIWNSSKVLLASVVFTGETASGWQTMFFSSPVSITANTEYYIGVHYSATDTHLSEAVFSAPSAPPVLNFIAGGYVSGTTLGAPTVFTAPTTNYGVDVLFLQTGADAPAVPESLASFFSDTAPASTAAAVANTDYGNRFTVDNDGYIAGGRFFKTGTASGVHTLILWNAIGSGGIIAKTEFVSETASGWQEVRFKTPIRVTSGTTYTISLRNTAGTYALFEMPPTALTTPTFLNLGYAYYGSALLSAPATLRSPAVYGVDILYYPDLSATSGTISLSGKRIADEGSDLLFTLTQSVFSSADTTVQVSTSSGGTATSGTDFSPVSLQTVVIPSGSLSATFAVPTAADSLVESQETIYASIVGSAVNSACVLTVATATDFGTVIDPPMRLFSDSDVPSASVASAVQTLGMRVVFSASGHVSGIRYYKPAGLLGKRTGGLWTATNILQASVSFENETASGWQEARFSSPVAVTRNTTYYVGVFYDTVSVAPSYEADYTSRDFSGYINITGGGKNTSTVLSAPAGSISTAHYFVDCLFTPSSLLPAIPEAGFSRFFVDADTPALVDDTGTAIAVGHYMQSSTAGYVGGFRFYKPSTGVGVHTLSLWDNGAALLKQVKVATETASGWQEVKFKAPFKVTAGQVFFMTLHCSAGHFAYSDTFSAPSKAANLTNNGGRYQNTTNILAIVMSNSVKNYFVDIDFFT